MNADQSIPDFFYNIIPGGLFIMLLKHYDIFDVFSFFPLTKLDSASFIFVDLLLALLLGFVFQGMTKLARKYLYLDSLIAEEVKNNNDDKYKKIEKNLNASKVLSNFYLMDNYLRGFHPAFLANHFSSRFAFWSNIFFASSLLLTLRIIFVRPFALDIDYLFILAFILFSKEMWKEYHYSYYDAILKSYFMQNNNNKIK
jgi:hypothetical protein